MRRDERFRDEGPVGASTDATDQRTPFEVDRDRILYCSAFRRLAGVTQVVTSLEGHLFHNRLTHSMKAAQIGRRIAQRVHRECPTAPVDPEVVEAAALAHDLGHPPFGHMGEMELDALAKDAGGYEGNAQTFRILTRLATRRPDFPGLNLSRATLAATIKYPWLRAEAPAEKAHKWNAYPTERELLEFAMGGSRAKTLEALLMEWSDDIAYSVHDLEDFFRAGLIPLNELVVHEAERARFLDARMSRIGRILGISRDDAEFAAQIFELAPPELQRRYEGSIAQRGALRLFTSRLIARYVKGLRIQANRIPQTVEMPAELHAEIVVLKELMGHYVYNHQALAAQQHGHRKVVRRLYNAFKKAIAKRELGIVPIAFRDVVEDQRSVFEDEGVMAARLAADIVASLTEHQAIALSRRLDGADPGTVRDVIH